MYYHIIVCCVILSINMLYYMIAAREAGAQLRDRRPSPPTDVRGFLSSQSLWTCIRCCLFAQSCFCQSLRPEVHHADFPAPPLELRHNKHISRSKQARTCVRTLKTNIPVQEWKLARTTSTNGALKAECNSYTADVWISEGLTQANS